MIFATVGTHQDGFPRMLAALESIGGDEELIVQYGNGEPPRRATETHAFLPLDDMTRLFEEARVVVTHAGVGSILLATRAGHTPIVVPRVQEAGEHVDDHQVELAAALEAEQRVVVCWKDDDLAALVARAPAPAAPPEGHERPIAVAVGRALRGDDGARRPSVLAEAVARFNEGKVMRLAHDSIGAYFTVGVEFQPQPLGPHAEPNALAGYYCDFSRKADPGEYAPGSWLANALGGRPWRSPMDVAQAALGFWERHLGGEDTAQPFLALADWLVRHATPSHGGIGWSHGYAVPKYGLTPGWLSGLTQGQALSVLVRAHALSDDERYLDAARAGFAPFTVDVSDGGIVRELDGTLVIEEYPTTEPTAVLNGWIFGMFGLHDLALAVDDADVRDVHRRTREGLLALLPRYDAGWWSLYSLGRYGRPDLAKPFYQRLHVALLDALDLIEPDPRLAATARRFEAQITPAGMARIAADKLAFRAIRAVHARAGR